MVVRVLVVDDYQPWLRFTRSMLQDASELQIVAEASDGRDAVQKALQLQPELILLDLGLPTFTGIEAARQIRETNPNATILFVSEERSQDVIQEALRIGSGYVVKSYAPRELVPAIKTVLEGGRFVSAGMVACDSTGKLKATPAKAGNHHTVSSYPDTATFVDGFVQFVRASLRNGGAVVVLARESHRVGVLQKLRAEGVDVAAAIEQQRYFPLEIPDGFQTFQFAEYLATEALKAARERNLRVEVG